MQQQKFCHNENCAIKKIMKLCINENLATAESMQQRKLPSAEVNFLYNIDYTFEICMVDQLFRSFPGLEAVIQATGIQVFNGTAMHKTAMHKTAMHKTAMHKTAMHKTGIQIVSPGGWVCR